MNPNEEGTMAPPVEATPVAEPVIEVMPEVKMEGTIASIEPMPEAAPEATV